MAVAGQEALLVRSLEDYVRRSESGDVPDPLDYASELGDTFPQFLDAVEAKEALDALIEPAGISSVPESIGPYTVLRRLGRGALGSVYEARHRRLDRTVALKLLHDAWLDDEDKRIRFRREARICARFQHDHLVPMLDAGEEDGRPYCAMQLIPGRSLKQEIEAGAMQPTPAFFREVAGLADGLATLHAAGIVHRDVKPSNILVDPTGRMILTDFGLARSDLDVSVTETGSTLGTLPYLAPERLSDPDAGPTPGADVYALGATLYEMLAGRPAFSGPNAPAVLMKIKQGRPEPLGRVREDLPVGCARIVEKAMQPRCDDRYASAAAMRDDLLRLAAGEEVQAAPVPWARRALRTAMHYAPQIGLATILVLSVFLWTSTRPARLILESLPAADVYLDGTRLGRTPLDIEVDAGEHRLAYRRDGFGSVETTFRVDAGGTYALNRPLDPRSPQAWQALTAAQTGAAPEGLFPLEYSRGTPVGVALWPRGPVDREELRTLVFQFAAGTGMGADLPRRATCFLRRGDEELWHTDFRPDTLQVRFPLPPAVFERLRAGDLCTWGVRSRRGKPVVARVQIVGPDAELAEALATIDAVHAGAGERGSVPRLLARVCALLEAERPLAAYREVEPLLGSEARLSSLDPAEQAIVYGLAQRCLRALHLRDSRQYTALHARIRALDPAIRQLFFYEPGASPSSAGPR